jgi:hypothetical protein
MGKGKRLLAGSVLALAVSGIVQGPALAGWGPDTHGVAIQTPGQGQNTRVVAGLWHADTITSPVAQGSTPLRN